MSVEFEKFMEQCLGKDWREPWPECPEDPSVGIPDLDPYNLYGNYRFQSLADAFLEAWRKKKSE